MFSPPLPEPTAAGGGVVVKILGREGFGFPRKSKFFYSNSFFLFVLLRKSCKIELYQIIKGLARVIWSNERIVSTHVRNTKNCVPEKLKME
jgi:hypothetical protein